LHPIVSIANTSTLNCINTDIVDIKDYHKIKPVSRRDWLNNNYTRQNRLAWAANQIGCSPFHLETVEGYQNNEYDYWQFKNPNTGLEITVLTGQKSNGDFVMLGKQIQE
jgi:hypothetical protein